MSPIYLKDRAKLVIYRKILVKICFYAHPLLGFELLNLNDVSIEGENRLDKNEPSKYNNLALLQGLLIYKVFLSTLYAPFLLSSLEI